MKCKICSKEFTPRQVYCSPNCRIKSFRKKNGNVTNGNEAVTEQSGSSNSRLLRNGNVNVTESIGSSDSRLLGREAIREFKERLMNENMSGHPPFELCKKCHRYNKDCKCK
jgi:hypothetical protein